MAHLDVRSSVQREKKNVKFEFDADRPRLSRLYLNAVHEWGKQLGTFLGDLVTCENRRISPAEAPQASRLLIRLAQLTCNGYCI
jgi:hypothetical protein